MCRATKPETPETGRSKTQRITINRRWWQQTWVFATGLVLATILVYLPAMRGEFVWDDDSWTTNISNLLHDTSGLGLMWSKLGALQQYYPVTGTSFWLGYHLWGFHPVYYHIENALLHACAALLFWKLLRQLRVSGAWLAAAIFALHPVMVESVAWITEQKNVLSMVLFLSALLAYGRFANYWQPPAEQAAPQYSRRPWTSYCLALIFFAAALLAKITVFSFPAVILLVCWWKRGRIRWWADVLPALPFFAMAIVVGSIAKWVETYHVGAHGADFALSFPERLLVAGRSVWFYIAKLLWPAELCFVYPRWNLEPASFWQWLYPISAIAALLGLWLARSRIGRGPITAALFFVGTLFPVLGFINAYFMRFSFVCDHWVYLSSLGPIALASAGAVRLAERLPLRNPLYTMAGITLSLLCVMTWNQCATYLNVETLWRTTLAYNPRAFLALNNLGLIVAQQGHFDDAMALFSKAVEASPDYREALSNLGNGLLRKGQTEEALVYLRHAREVGTNDPGVYVNLGNALFQAGQLDEAAAQFLGALEINPGHAEANNNLGVVLLHKQQFAEAARHFEKALEARPNYAEAHNNLGVALLKTGHVEAAISHFQQALATQPDYPQAQDYLNKALLQRTAAP